MKISNNGFDDHQTYFEHNICSSKIPTIFIHGVGLDNNMWMPQKKYFKNKEIIFYDLLNHGKTIKGYKKLTFENFNTQLNQLVKYLNIKKFNLIGFSIGALIAQHFATKYYHKINKLIIIASVYKRTNSQIIKVKNRYKMLLSGKSIINNSINRWFNQEYLKKNPDVYNYFSNILQKNKSEDFLPAYKLFVESDDYALDFSKLKTPTLVITGENEVGSTPNMSEMLHKEIKNSNLYIVPQAKHMASFEKDKLVNEKIFKFIY